jgi:hypothetical protein
MGDALEDRGWAPFGENAFGQRVSEVAGIGKPLGRDDLP